MTMQETAVNQFVFDEEREYEYDPSYPSEEERAEIFNSHDYRQWQIDSIATQCPEAMRQAVKEFCFANPFFYLDLYPDIRKIANDKDDEYRRDFDLLLDDMQYQDEEF